jgi:flagellar hook-associated protein 3 FlgL
MRIDPNIVPDIVADLQQSQQTLNTALQEVSTGYSVTLPSQNPTAAAEVVQVNIEAGEIDQYTQNDTTVLATVQQPSSVLSAVVTSLDQAVSIGTQGANGTNNASDYADLAEQVQGILSDVVADANTEVGGQYLFGGTANAVPYTPTAGVPNTYTYNGNNETSTVAIGSGQNIQTSLPGSTVFSNPANNVLGALGNLVTALQSGNSAQIQTATSAVSSAVGYIGQQQVFYTNAETQLNDQSAVLQQDTVTLSTETNNLIGANLSTAATNLSQAETDNSAALAAAAKVLPNTLLNYLSPPN